TTTVRGHGDGDRIFIRALAGATALFGDEGADNFFLSSNANMALFTHDGDYDDLIDPLEPGMPLSGDLTHLGGLTIDTGTGGNGATGDAIYLSADNASAGLVGSLEDQGGQHVISGLGMTGTIAYTVGFEAALVIELGDHADTFHIKNVPASVVAYIH